MQARVRAESAKPSEVEGFFDIYFYTPLGGLAARTLAPTGISPNGVSWLSVAAAFGAAGAYLSATLAGTIAATLLFLLSGVLDSADGQLARATGRTSELGETLDGFCDSLSFGLVYAAGALVFILHHAGPALLIVVAAAAAAFSHSLQSSLVDFERQLFVHFVTGRGRVVREDAATLQREREAARASGEGWWPQALWGMRLSYCARQRRWLSGSVALLDRYQRDIAGSPERMRAFAERYREATTPLLRAWTLLAPNSHTVGVLVCGLAPFLFPQVPIARFGLALVFAFDLALNLAVPPLILAQRRIDRRLTNDIAGQGLDGQGIERVQ